MLEKRQLKDEEEEMKWKVSLVKLYLNQSLCSIRLGRPKLAIVQCRNVLDLDGKNVKATFRMGQVRDGLLISFRTVWGRGGGNGCGMKEIRK